MGCAVEHVEVVPADTILAEASMEEKALHQLRLIFDKVDSSKNNSVSKDELSTALREDESLGGLLKEAGLNDVFFVLNQLDSHGNHSISWTELQEHLKEAAAQEVTKKGHILAAERLAEEQAMLQLKTLFKELDTDEDGAVSKDELAARLKQEGAVTGEEDSLGRLVEQAGFSPDWNSLEGLDTNKDGRVTWDELETHLRKAAIEVVLEDLAIAKYCCGCCGPL